MPKPIKFTYEKKAAFRDAFYFIIVCEGGNREPDYFKFFDGISSRVKVVPVPNEEGNGSPAKLMQIAMNKEKELEVNDQTDRVWFVIDTDRWREQLHEIRQECNKHPHWKVAQSNPCFEVWLYFHLKAQLPPLENFTGCGAWKTHLPEVIHGGFNTDYHPIAIETAISNSKNAYVPNGYFPQLGCTQLWELGEELIAVVKKEIAILKDRFPAPKPTQ